MKTHSDLPEPHFGAKVGPWQGPKCSSQCFAAHVKTQRRPDSSLFDERVARAALLSKGFAKFHLAVGSDLAPALASLCESFPLFPHDPRDQNCTRRRGYQKYIFCPWNGTLTPRPVSTYFQDAEFNSLDGGFPREFAPLGELAENTFIIKYIKALFAAIPILPKSLLDSWDVGVHVIRMEARPGVPALASPPWPHRDGEPVTTIGVFGRENIQGGRTLICQDVSEKKEPVGILEDTILEPLDSAIILDARVFHHVTDVNVADGKSPGHRDVLLVEFTPLRQDYRPLKLAQV